MLPELLVAAARHARRGHRRRPPTSASLMARVEQRRRGVRVVVGAADRLGHDLVHDARARSMSGAVSLSAVGRFDLPRRVAPQDRGAALGRDHAVDGELLDQDPVADRDAERAAAAAFAADDDDDGTCEDRHLAQVVGDRLGDAALFRLDAGIRRRRVHDDDDRPAELLGQLHRAQRLAVALGLARSRSSGRSSAWCPRRPSGARRRAPAPRGSGPCRRRSRGRRRSGGRRGSRRTR